MYLCAISIINAFIESVTGSMQRSTCMFYQTKLLTSCSGLLQCCVGNVLVKLFLNVIGQWYVSVSL